MVTQKSEIGAVVVGGMPLQAESDEPKLVGATIEKIGINNNPYRSQSFGFDFIHNFLTVKLYFLCLHVGDTLTLAHDHDARLAYSQTDDFFLLVWEVDGTHFVAP